MLEEWLCITKSESLPREPNCQFKAFGIGPFTSLKEGNHKGGIEVLPISKALRGETS